MENVIRKFDGLLMSQQFDFLKCIGGDTKSHNLEAEVLELYQEYTRLTNEEQSQVEGYVTNWVESLTREEMYAGARHENIVRNSEKKNGWQKRKKNK